MTSQYDMVLVFPMEGTEKPYKQSGDDSDDDDDNDGDDDDDDDDDFLVDDDVDVDVDVVNDFIDDTNLDIVSYNIA